MNRKMRDRHGEGGGSAGGKGRKNRWSNGCKNRQSNGWENRQSNGWENRQSNGWENRRKHMGAYLIEMILFLACIAGMIGFFRIRKCPLDIPALILWGVVLLVLVPLLIRGEIRLRREEERIDNIQGRQKNDGSRE